VEKIAMVFEKYIPGEPKNKAYEALFEMMKDFDNDKSYADMIRYRISGACISVGLMIYSAPR
jgi:hypothetical protein